MNRTYYIDFDNPAQRMDFLRKLGQLKGLYEFTFKQRKQIRSIPQNRFYRGPVIEAYCAGYKNATGENITEEEAHALLGERFLKSTKRIVNTTTGEEEVRSYVRSTASLSKEEFSEYLEHCIQFIAEWFGEYIPENR